MRGKPRRRPMHYVTFSFADGAAITCAPKRKPSKRSIKAEGIHIDEDCVIREYQETIEEFEGHSTEIRARVSDLMANRLNTRRALRELVMPSLARIEETLLSLHERLQRIEESQAELQPPS